MKRNAPARYGMMCSPSCGLGLFVAVLCGCGPGIQTIYEGDDERVIALKKMGVIVYEGAGVGAGEVKYEIDFSKTELTPEAWDVMKELVVDKLVLTDTDFSDADVVTMYLLPMLNEKLRPQLLKMKPGTRLASHQFTMGNCRPDEKRTIGGHDALFWVVPAQVGGTWRVEPPGGGEPLQLELKQEYQDLEAKATWGARPAVVSDLGLSGGSIRFAVADGQGALYRFKGTAGHDGKMSGTVIDRDGREQPFTATRTSP